MKLTKAAILAIRGGSGIKKKIAKALGVSVPTIYRWLSDNDDNLTKSASLEVIRKETGLPDSEIIDKETKKRTAAI